MQVLTHTAEVKIVRTVQGVNLGKLKDTHEIYKEVLHDVIDLDEALARLDEVINAKDRHPVWLCVIMYGLASAAVSVFFKARFIDMPIIFVLGSLLGVLQLVISPLSKTYSTVFEISATIMMTFLARAFGSINNGGMFCFSAIAQSAIAMILPGWVRIISASHGTQLIVPARPELCPGTAVSRYCARFYPFSLCHHILALPRLRHHRGNSDIWRHRLPRHEQHDLRKPAESVLELPICSPLRILHYFHGAGQVQADAGYDLHCHGWIYRQLLRQHEVLVQRSHRIHLRSVCRWRACEPVQPVTPRCCRCCPSSRRLRPSAR
jgi:hypothetical protein